MLSNDHKKIIDSVLTGALCMADIHMLEIKDVVRYLESKGFAKLHEYDEEDVEKFIYISLDGEEKFLIHYSEWYGFSYFESKSSGVSYSSNFVEVP